MTTDTETKTSEAYTPTDQEKKDQDEVLDTLTRGRQVMQKKYNYLNGRSILECVDDWQKRWNGWIPPSSELDDYEKSQIFLNFTRKAIIGYLAMVAMNPPKSKVSAVNKRTGFPNRMFAQVLEDLKRYSETNEVFPAKFLKFALATTTDGTAYAYEGYLRDEQEYDFPVFFDPKTGKITYTKKKRMLFDDCFAEIVRLKDLYILNPFESDLQKQPKILWRKLISLSEAEKEFGHYKNWKHVKPGITNTAGTTTFYGSEEETEYATDKVEVMRLYKRSPNRHVLMVGNVVLYGGPNPFKDARFPFSKGIYEPFGIDFSWGMGYPQKVMGEQDAMNTGINLMADKAYNSMLPYGLSSDLDDLIDDDVLSANKIRKVGDINKWKIDTLPGLSTADLTFVQTMLNLAREFSGTEGGANQYSPRGGKLQVRQVLLRQEETMKSIGFSGNFLEDAERDRAELRIGHILQFYAIPKIEKITGKNKKEIEQLVYRDITVQDVELGNGKRGVRKIKLLGDELMEDDKMRIADELSVIEEVGEMAGTSTEALAVHVDTFLDYNYSVQIEKASSFERNQVLEQSKRQEYANWRIGLSAVAPTNVAEIVAWVDESMDVDTERFRGGNSEVPAGMGQQVSGGESITQDMGPSNTPQLNPLSASGA